MQEITLNHHFHLYDENIKTFKKAAFKTRLRHCVDVLSLSENQKFKLICGSIEWIFMSKLWCDSTFSYIFMNTVSLLHKHYNKSYLISIR